MTVLPPMAGSRHDAAIVLGARIGADGRPGPALCRRVAHAVALVRQGRAGHLVMSGGAVGHPRPEALAMRDLALAAGIDPARVVVDPVSRNTIGNARAVAAIVAAWGWTRLLLVTDSFHMPRARYVFHRQGLAVDPAPVALAGSWLAWGREGVALPWTVARVEWGRWRRHRAGTIG